MNIIIREAVPASHRAMIALWNQSVDAGEVIYSPMDAETFAMKLEGPNGILLAAEAGGRMAGWIHGVADETAAPDVPGYLTVVFVAPEYRRQGIGAALVRVLADRFAARGRRLMACSGNSPVHLSWIVPGTPGHDHNNAPGVDEQCTGYPFLIACGMEARFHEVAMYRDLAGYEWPANMDGIRERLLAEGIYAGLYDGKQALGYDGMCDRVGSEYWRGVLREELGAWQRGEPNPDETLWVDGQRPKGPRPLLVAVRDGQIVGFTGPVDKQKSGRGWFTGICVDPLYGRRSIGALLFNLLLQAFVDEGAAFTTLFTGADNHAQQIYRRAGLRVVRPFAVMVKPLGDGAEYTQTHF